MLQLSKIVQHYPEYLLFGGHYIRVLRFISYPVTATVALLRNLWMNKDLIELGVHLRLVTRLEPTKLRWDMSTQWKYRRLYYSIAEAESKLGEVARPEEVAALQALEDIKNKTVATSYGRALFDMWNYLTISARTLSVLNEATEIVVKELNGLGIKLSNSRYEQAEAFQASGWIASSGPSKRYQQLNYGRMVDQDAIGVFFPFLFGSNSDPQGIYNGHRVYDNKINLIDVTAGEGAHNFLVMGATGQGKSAAMKDYALSFFYDGFRVFVFDVDGEYRAICEEVGGLWIDHTMQSGSYTDPTRIAAAIGEPEHDYGRYKEAIEATIRTISLLAGGLEPAELNAVDRAVLNLFSDAGILEDDPSTWDRPHGGIHHWYQYLKQDTSPGAITIREKIWRYFEGSLKNMFAKEATDDRISTSDFVVFHVGQGIDNDADAHTAMVKLNMAFTSVWNEIKKEKARGERYSVIICDEMQRSLPNPHFAQFTNKVVTTIRKYNGIWMGGLNNPAVLWPDASHNQDVANAGTAIWQNTNYKIFFWMEQDGIELLAAKSGMPVQVVEKISTLQGTHQFVFRKGERSYDLLIKKLPPQELAKGLYKTRGLKAGV